MIAATVLAAGASRRLGRPKQLVPFRGEPLVRRALEAASAAALRSVVLGANAAEISPLVDGQVFRLENTEWQEGIASSIRTAVRWAVDTHASALVLLLGDQPLVEAEHVAQLVGAWRARGADAVGSAYAGIVGAPALFDRTLFRSLLALTGDAGAGNVLRAHRGVVTVPCPAAELDVDTPADLTAAR